MIDLLLVLLCRPLNRIMIAQRITQPTMWVSIIAAAQHVPATHLFVAKWDYLGAAYASVRAA